LEALSNLFKNPLWPNRYDQIPCNQKSPHRDKRPNNYKSYYNSYRHVSKF